MKKIILGIVLLLIASFAFANSNRTSSYLNEKPSIEESIKIDKSENTLSVETEYIYLYDSWGVGCYANIYYNGELVGTVYSYAYGDTKSEATTNCYNDVRGKANAFMKKY